MRALWFLVALTVVGLIGCNFSVGQQSYIPPTPDLAASTPPSVPGFTERSTARYVYVVDRTQQKLFVYPAGVADPSPIRTVSFNTQPIAVVTDAQGAVYVSLWTSKVAIFNSGATNQTGTITKGLYEPSGMSIDAQGNLWVANRHVPQATLAYVQEYSVGNHAAARTVTLPKGFYAFGIAVSKQGDLWVNTMQNGIGGGSVLGYPADSSQSRYSLETAGGGGVAFDVHGTLEVSTLASILFFAPPNWARADLKYYGQGSTIHLMTEGTDGSLYIPVQVQGGQSYILVEPSENARSPYRITKGLADPNGAAAGS